MYKILAAKSAVYRFTIYVLLIGIIVFSGCSASKQVTRVDTDTTIDLSGRWNDTDSRMVAEGIIGDCLNHPWINDHGISAGGKPVVIVGGIRNKSMEHIAVATFISDIERAFINSGKVRTVSSSSERGEIREERADQGEFSALETVKQMGRELGADYMMTGEINTIEDREGGDQVVFYQTDLTLTNIETNEKIWIGQKKIKKFIGRGKFKM
ncbi:MAG: penicillin-binding protein activator LpoB [Candidatus Poribacteria bacterium]|nr:penicillin-binding protein activator LpoB [Candidatus Poribacteria bacterium]